MKKAANYLVPCLFFMSASVHATVLFDNGTTIDQTNTTWNTTYPSNSVVDDFQLTQTATITDIRFSLFAVSGSEYVQSYVTILDGIGGSTVVTPFATTGVLSANGLASGNPLAPNGFDVVLSGLNVNLIAGTYALVFETEMSPNFSAGIASGDSGFGSTLVVNGFDTPNHVAFSLEQNASGSAPAPATLALLGFGLAGIGYQRRKQIKAA